MRLPNKAIGDARALSCRALLALVAALFLAGAAVAPAAAQTEGREVAPEMPSEGQVPGGALGNLNDAEIWRAVRHGIEGTVSIPDKKAGVLVQSEGDNWRAWRNGPITQIGLYAMGGMLILLVLFFAIRGRIRIDAGPSGRTMERFNGVERFAHWLTAVCFIILALTGLNLLYGKHLLLPALGPEAFAAVSLAGKYAHNYLSFGFMLGIALMFVLWVRHNIPNKQDVFWLVEGGGLFTKGYHPATRKFNGGQKVIFWLVILGGLSLSLSGLALLFPFQFSFFNWTFGLINLVGTNLPTDLTALQEMQLSQLWHSVVGCILIAVILAHIYIGSIGMEGAFAAMGSGQVDENWAREHHSIWVAEVNHEPLPDPDEVRARHMAAAE